MKQLKEIEQKLAQNIHHIKQQYQIKQLGIFGSYIRGEATENSDLDILVEFEPQAKFGLLTFCELENYRERTTYYKSRFSYERWLKTSDWSKHSPRSSLPMSKRQLKIQK